MITRRIPTARERQPGPDGWSLVSARQGALDEFVASALLLVFILVLLERRSTNAPIGWFFPVALGISMMLLVIMEGPISTVSLNAACDPGSLILLWLTAFPGPRGDGWATTIAPTLGAIFGAYLVDFVLRPCIPKEAKPEVEAEKKPAPLREKVPA